MLLALEDGTFTNAERRIQRVRKVMSPKKRLRRQGNHAAARQRHGVTLELCPPQRDHG